MKLFIALLLFGYSFCSFSLSAEQKTYEFESTAIFKNNMSVLRLHGYNPNDVKRAVDWILEAVGARVNKFTSSDGNYIEGSFTTLVESANGSIPAEYAAMAIAPSSLKCHMMNSILLALMDYLPIRNYREIGECRAVIAGVLRPPFIVRFEVLKRTDSSFQPSSIYTREGRKPYSQRNYALYQRDDGLWFKYLKYPSPYGSIESPALLSGPLAQRIERVCNREYDMENNAWRSCKNKGIVTIQEVE